MPKQNKWYEMKGLASGAAEIYIYDEIGYWGVTAKEFARDLKEIKATDSITLRINSPGGSVTDGIAIYNLLKNHQAQVNVHIDGLAASMASIIAMAGDTITMPENALMMIHNPWGHAMGDSEEMRKTADVLDKMKKALLSAYANKSGRSDEELDELMTAETWMTGAEAVEMGFADQVTDEVMLAASFDVSKIQNYANDKTSLFKPLAQANTTPEEVRMTTKVKTAPNADPNVVTEPVAVNKIDVEAVEAKAIVAYEAKQTARKKEIRTAFGSFSEKHAVLLNACLEDSNCSLEVARGKLLDELGKDAAPQKGSVSGHVGNGAIVKESMVAAMKSRAGIKLDDNEMSKDNPYRTMSLVDMARASLVEKGVGVAGMSDRMQLVGAAFTHSQSDFGNVLADVANKSMLMGYEEAEETFQLWTQTGSLSDFKISNRVALNDMKSLREVRPGAEFKYATVGDRGEKIALATYGELISLNRQTIINDDLGAFTRLARLMGDAAIRTIGDLVYAVLTSNPNMANNAPLFSTTNKNLRTGAGGALSVDSLTKARTAMRTQKLEDGKALNIRPEFLLVPAALETAASKLMADTVLSGANNNESNPVAGMSTVVTEARLDDASPTAWYLAGGRRYDTIEVAYLDGNSSPFLDQMEGWSIDGTSFKVRLDAGVSPLDHRPLYKSNGA